MWGPVHTGQMASWSTLAVTEPNRKRRNGPYPWVGITMRSHFRSEVRRTLHVATGPYRTDGVMEHLGGDRAQQETSERSVPVGRHHNEVALLTGSKLDDGLRRVALPHDAAYCGIGGRTTGEGLQVHGALLGDLAGQIARAGIGHGFEGAEIRQRRNHHVKQNDFTVEVTGKGFGIL